MKRTILFLLTLLGITSAMAHDFEVDGIYYNITDNTVEVTFYGDNEFNPAIKYENDVVIPESVTNEETTYSVTSIGKRAFWSCTGMTSVTIPSSVTSIGEYAFVFCSGLTSITIPQSVTSIGELAFEYCSGLADIVVNENNTTYNSRNNCNAIIETATNNLIVGCKNTTIPEGVTSIGDFAFARCTELTSVTIPNSVNEIGEYAFSQCTYLTGITCLAVNPPTIDESTFNSVDKSISLYVPTGSIEDYKAAQYWEEFTNIYGEKFEVNEIHYIVTANDEVAVIGEDYYSGNIAIPESVIYNDVTYRVTSIGESAFAHCTELTSVTIPGSVTSIGEYAFYRCIGLTEITIPENVISIDGQAFRLCSGLTEIIIPNSVTSTGESVFAECSSLASVTIGNSVTSIGEGTFNSCYGLTSVTIGNSVTSIGKSAFYYCSGLTSVIIPNSVTTIGQSAFEYCSALTSVTIGNSVTEIGDRAFYRCTGLTEITCLVATPPTVYSSTFYNVTNTIPVYVPAESVATYNGWGDFTNILPLNTNITTENVYYLDCNNQTEWNVEAGSNVQAVFTNVITGYKTTVQGSVVQNTIEDITYTSVVFYLAEGNSLASTGVSNATYTHIEFTLTNVTRSSEAILTTGALYLADADKYIYRLATNEWVSVNQATDIEETVAEEAIEVRGDVVTALGDIYVYNMSGAMVANGRNEIDLSALQRGIYLIQVGGTVKKVVK